MPIDKWDPLQDLIGLRQRFLELVDRSFRQDMLGQGVGPLEAWIPPADFMERDNELVLTMEIPGVDQKDIEIRFDGNQVTVRGERSATFGTSQAAVHRMERQHGPFRRVFDLPVPVDPEKIEARYESGVLTIRMPVRSPMKERKIPVEQN
jgi:HSP20 family protein